MYQIYDSHIHLGSSDRIGRKPFFASIDAALAYLKSCSCNGAVFTLWQGIYAKTAEELCCANREALELAERYKGYLVPGASVHPDFVDASISSIDSFIANGSKWVGELLPNEHKPYCCEEYLRIFRYCQEKGCIVQLHTDPEIIKLAGVLGDLKIVYSHIPDDQTLKELVPLKNITLDFCGYAGGLAIGRLETALELLGPDRLIFGTDFDGYDPIACLARLNSAVKDARIVKKLLSENLLRLLASAGMENAFKG